MNKMDELRQQLLAGRISRREFCRLAGALAGAAAIPAALRTTQAQADVPKRGGHIRVGSSQGSTTDVLDPSQLTSGLTQMLFYTYLSQLTEVSNTGELIASVAQSWEPSADAKSWTFDLRKDVEFHNGKTLVADDVIATFALHRGAKSKSAMRSFADQIVEMKKDGNHRVNFRLKEGNADFPYILSSNIFGLLPSENGELQASAGIGSGSYMIEAFEPGVRVRLKRNPHYFRDDVAFFDSAEIIVTADTVARQTALLTGEVEVIDQVDPKTAHLVEKNDAVKLLDVPGPWHFDFPMRVDTPPFDNNDVRLALKYAIDREEILDKVLRGHGTLGNDQPISKTYRYFASELPQRAFDPDKSRFHLKKAGLGNLKVELSSSESVFPGAVDTALLYREQAARAGIDITLNRVPNDGYWSDVWMKHPWCASNWSGRATEDWMFTQAYGADSSWNETFWKNERFNELLKRARTELAPAKRREMYVEMQRLVRDDGGAVIPVFANYVMGLSEQVKHQRDVSGQWPLDGYKFLERWWFA